MSHRDLASPFDELKPVTRSPLEFQGFVPEERLKDYYLKGYYQPQTIAQFLQESLSKYADQPAAIGLSHQSQGEGPGSQEQKWTYKQLAAQAELAAQRLQSLGARKGDRVLLQLPNCLEFLSYMVGSFQLGLVPVFCLPKHRERELEHFARQVDPAIHIFAQGAENCDYWSLYRAYSQRMLAANLRPPLALDITEPGQGLEPQAGLPGCPDAEETADKCAKPWESVALFQLSGGTTGRSKMIPRTHMDYLYSVRESAHICQLSPQTKMLVVLPAAHNFTMSSPGILGVLYSGGTLIMAGDPSPQTAFGLIQRHGATMASLVPALARAWALLAERGGLSFPSLELVQVGGAKFSPSAARHLVEVLGVKLQQVFGMAEGLVNYTRLDDPLEIVLTTQGRPISPDDEILILDDQDKILPAGQAGHLLTRGPYTIGAYYREEKANRESFTDQGFYRTGDLVVAHPSGHLEVVGRAKDQINRAGEKISVDEIEDFALQLPAVQDAVAVGLPDPDVGERICLVLLAGDLKAFGPSPLDYVRRAYRQAGFATYKLPERVELLSQFPLTKVGKISRKELRERIGKIISSPQ